MICTGFPRATNPSTDEGAIILPQPRGIPKQPSSQLPHSYRANANEVYQQLSAHTENVFWPSSSPCLLEKHSPLPGKRTFNLWRVQHFCAASDVLRTDATSIDDPKKVSIAVDHNYAPSVLRSGSTRLNRAKSPHESNKKRTFTKHKTSPRVSHLEVVGDLLQEHVPQVHVRLLSPAEGHHNAHLDRGNAGKHPCRVSQSTRQAGGKG